jgi:hypothetical protein
MDRMGGTQGQRGLKPGGMEGFHRGSGPRLTCGTANRRNLNLSCAHTHLPWPLSGPGRAAKLRGKGRRHMVGLRECEEVLLER